MKTHKQLQREIHRSDPAFPRPLWFTRWLPRRVVTLFSPSGEMSLGNILVDSSEVTRHLYSAHSDNHAAAFF